MSLDEIMLRYGCDKSSAHHNYCVVYEKYFAPIRKEHLNILELGIGGYNYHDKGGADLNAFAEYFPNAIINGVDIYYKQITVNNRVNLFQCSQDDEGALKNLIKIIGVPDIVIDDASHIVPLTIRTFEILFPMIKKGGMYIVEDAHTCFWKKNYEGCDDKGNKDYPHIHNIIDKGDYNILHKSEKLIILRK